MDYINLYADFLKKFLKPKRPLCVVFDCSNGTAGLILSKLKIACPARENLELIIINGKPDGNFPAHGPNPMAKDALRELKEAVLRHRADLGVILDADGDRVFFMDNLGREINPDVAAVLISKNFSGPVTLDARSGYLIREALAADKKSALDSRVGHYFIKKLMSEKQADFGAEQSGHYYFKFKGFSAKSGSAYWDSGILGAIHLINALPENIAAWIDRLPKYFQSGEINFSIKDKTAALKKIKSLYAKKSKTISELDGLKMEFNSPSGEWWFSLRSSNTENLLRLNIEAKKESVLNEHLRQITKNLVK